MALRLRDAKDVKKCSYYVWYLGAREARGVDAMPAAIAYLLERERLQEPFKVTLQVSANQSASTQLRQSGFRLRALSATIRHLSYETLFAYMQIL